jgi:outer membrane lipoprotein-sorting protein
MILTLTIILIGCFEKTHEESIYEEVVKKYMYLDNYTCKVEITVNSNKTSNFYKAEQFCKGLGNYRIEYLFPEDIRGLVILYDNNNIDMVYEELNKRISLKDYNDNILYHFIDSFWEIYFNSEESKVSESDDIILFEVNIPGTNKYRNKMKLSVNRTDYKPENLTIYDYNENVVVDVRYTEFYTDDKG